MSRTKKSEAKFPNKLTVVHKNLLLNKGNSVYGLSYDEDSLVEIDPRQPPKDYLDTLIHETLHIIFPEWTEMQVFDLASFLAEQLWQQGYRKIYQEDDSTIYDVVPGIEAGGPSSARMKVAPPIKTTVYSRIKDEYEEMFKECKVSNPGATDKLVKKIIEHQSTYEKVGIAPWYWIGCIHVMEGSQSFKTHLHNGDPLKYRTRNVPSGRPAENPDTIYGYSWEVSAKDALMIKGLNEWNDWSIPGMLYQAERFNGWGYRMYKGVYSPYLWSGSQFWTKGKYVSDGKYDPNATSAQIGVAVLLKKMSEAGIF